MENQIEQKEMESVLPAPIESTSLSVFGDKSGFEHAQRIARMLGQSALIPKDYQNNIPNCMIALEMAQRIGASPLQVMQNIYVVHGRPAWSSQFLIATFNASGNFSPLRYEEDDQEGGRTRAVATDKGTGEMLDGVWVSMKMAEAEGWINKNGSKWKTMPQLMRRYRAAAFFVRQFAPELSMGMHTQEEVMDITEYQKPQAAEKKRPSLTPDHVFWQATANDLRDGKTDLDAIRAKYELSEEHETQLIKMVF